MPKKKKKKISYMQITSILSGNDLDEEVWDYSLNTNTIPLWFSIRESTYEKFSELPLQSPLTAFF